MEFEIEGGNLPYLVCHMNRGESLITEGGAMSWMSDHIHMDTTSRGGAGKAIGRMFAGESLFMNRFTAQQDGFLAISSSFPGQILELNIAPGKDIICQKKAFLCCEESVDLSIFFRKKIGAGLFGGEGFIMQRLSGNGKAFIEIDGAIKGYDLAAGERMLIDTGHLVMMEDTVSMDIQSTGNLKNVFFSGEGLFHTVVTGPGKVYVQSLPISKLAGLIAATLPNK